MTNNLDQSNSGNCSNKRDCMELLQLIVDGEATPAQKNHFRDHLDQCMPCYQQYHLDLAIRELLKVKCHHNAPPELIESIKIKIRQNIPY